MRRSSLLASAVFAATVLGSSAAFAAPINFTWNPAGVGLAGTQITNANNISPLNDFATIQVAGDGSFNESGALNITGFLNNASTVTSTGLGTAGGYSLYYVFNGSGTSAGIPTTIGQTTSGTYTSLNYWLVGSTTPLPNFSALTSTYYSTIAAANAAIGSAGDIILATGSLTGPAAGNTVSLQLTNTGLVPTANVEVTLNPCLSASAPCTGNEGAFFVDPTALTSVLQFGNFSATGTVVTGPTPCGAFNCVFINGGGGNITEVLAPVPEPCTLSVCGAGLVGAAALRRRKAKKA